MIRGIGIDLCQRDRFVKNLDDQKFLAKIFHKKELEILSSKEDMLQKSAYLAARWAAKESLVKALGRGMFDLPFYEMALCSQQSAPEWHFEPCVKKILEKENILQAWVSLSYEENMVVAMSVLEG